MATTLSEISSIPMDTKPHPDWKKTTALFKRLHSHRNLALRMVGKMFYHLRLSFVVVVVVYFVEFTFYPEESS